MEEYGKIRLYNARNDMLDMTNPDMFGADQEGLGVQFESEFRTADSHFLFEKSELQRKTLSLNLWLGDRTGQSYQRFSDLVAFLNHTPYRIEYETPTGTWSRDCILNELTKSLIKEESILVEELQLDFTTPFYIERSERTTDNPPIEGKAGKIYETVTRKRQVFETVPESYREGDLWHWQGEDFPGRNLIINNINPSILKRTQLDNFEAEYRGLVTFNGNKTIVTYQSDVTETRYRFNAALNPILAGLKPGKYYYFQTFVSGSGKVRFRNQFQTTGNWQDAPEPITVIDLKKDPVKMTHAFYLPENSRASYISLQLMPESNTEGSFFEFQNTAIFESSERNFRENPKDLTNGKSSGYFIATKSSNEFNFNDFIYYGQSANENTYYDKIYDYTYSFDDYPVETEESYYTYDYVYADEDEGKNVFQVDNHSVYIGSSKHSPCEITIYGPCENPHWQVTQGSKILQSDGFNLTVPEGHRLVVSSNPQSQRAVLIALDGTVSNVYQQQDLSKSNFVTFPVGRSKILFFNCDKVSFSYREERVTV